MTKEIIMRISCSDCGKRYNIRNDELDNYNIYWVQGGKLDFIPKLLCPLCTRKWTLKAKKNDRARSKQKQMITSVKE